MSVAAVAANARQSAVPRERAARGRSEKVRDSWCSIRVLQGRPQSCCSGEFRDELSQLSCFGSLYQRYPFTAAVAFRDHPRECGMHISPHIDPELDPNRNRQCAARRW
jgi:hypothetical protein